MATPFGVASDSFPRRVCLSLQLPDDDLKKKSFFILLKLSIEPGGGETEESVKIANIRNTKSN